MPAIPDPHNAMAKSLSYMAATIKARQDVVTGIIPTYYRIDGPSPGTVIGIVLGSVAGFLLLAWLLFSLTNGSTARNGSGATIAGEEEIVVRRRRGSQSHTARSSRRNSRPVMREYSRSPRQSGGGRSAVIVEERRTRPRSIVVEERSRSRVRGDDVVEVIEEHDSSDFRPPRQSRRGGYR